MSKETLRREIKGAELTAKEKELQVVYEELENALGVKTGKGKEFYYDEDRDRNDPLFDWSNLESPEMIDREKRFKAAYQYLHENFSDDFLKTTSVKPGPLFEKVGEAIVKATEAAHQVKNAKIEPIEENPLIRTLEANKSKFDSVMANMQDKSKENIELSPYKQRLQNMIKERIGR